MRRCELALPRVEVEDGDVPPSWSLSPERADTAKPGIYLEDLYIRPTYRGRGYGKALLSHIAQLAVTRGCGRFEWSVLDWNQRAIDFYKKLGAVPLNDWTMFRVSDQALTQLGNAVNKID